MCSLPLNQKFIIINIKKIFWVSIYKINKFELIHFDLLRYLQGAIYYRKSHFTTPSKILNFFSILRKSNNLSELYSYKIFSYLKKKSENTISYIYFKEGEVVYQN